MSTPTRRVSQITSRVATTNGGKLKETQGQREQEIQARTELPGR